MRRPALCVVLVSATLGVLSAACTPSNRPGAAPEIVPKPKAVEVVSAEQTGALARLELERDRLFATTTARDMSLSRRIRVLGQAEAVIRTRSHDAARTLGQLVPRSLFRLPGRVTVSEDGRRAALIELSGRTTASDCFGSQTGTYSLYDLATGTKIAGPLASASMDRVELGPNGRWLASSDNETVRVVNSENGRVLFEGKHSPCPDEDDIAAEPIEIVWHRGAQAIAAYSNSEGAELVVWGMDGKVLLRSVDFEPPVTQVAREALWRQLGLAPEAPRADTTSPRFVQHGDVFEVFAASEPPGGAPVAVFAPSTPARTARPIVGHPELVVVEDEDAVTVINWTDKAMFEAVCSSVEGGLSVEEWAESLPDWPWRARCDASVASEPKPGSNKAPIAERIQVLEAEISELWQQLSENNLKALAGKKTPEDAAMLVRLNALYHSDSPELRMELAQLVAARPVATQIPSLGAVSRVLPHPDGRLAFVLKDGRVELHNSGKGAGEVVATLDSEAAQAALQWAGDELMYATWHDEPESGSVSIGVRRVGSEKDNPPHFELGKKKREALDYGISPDGSYLVVADGTRGGQLVIWSVDNGTRVASVKLRALRRCHCCCGSTCPCPQVVPVRFRFSPDSRYVAVDAGQELPVYQLENGKRLTDASIGNPDGILDLQFSSDGTRLLSLFAWRFGGTEVKVNTILGGVSAKMLGFEKPWPT
ncbi:MAG: hypothetical protein ACPG4T_02695, partial [Nannocystaceae bacterium]